MTLVLSTEDLSRPMALFVELLAASPAFRSELGVASSALALPSICYPYASDREESVVERPRAIVDFGTYYQGGKQGSTLAGSSGDVFLAIEIAALEDSPRNPGNEFMDFLNRVGAIVSDLLDRAASDRETDEKILVLDDGSHLNVVHWRMVTPPSECERSNENDKLFYGCALILDWI